MEYKIKYILILFAFGIFFSCEKEMADEPKVEQPFSFRYAVVMKRIPESDGIEFYCNTYYPKRNKTLLSMKHFLKNERNVDTLFFKIGGNNDLQKGVIGVKCNLDLGISKVWNNGDIYSSYKFWHFPQKIITGPSDSVILYHFPEDTLANNLKAE